MTDAGHLHGVRTSANDRMVPEIILAVAEHRRRIARLLDRLDGSRRALVEIGVAALEDGSLDAATMLVQFRDRLRATDGDLEELAGEIESHRCEPPMN